MKFLIESLTDLDEQFKSFGGPGLFTFRGKPTAIFKRLHKELGINKICFEQDCEPIWNTRDEAVQELCNELGIETVQKVSHTLWNPMDVIRVNNGYAPLTYQMMLHTVNVLGLPPRPVTDVIGFSDVLFGTIPDHFAAELELFSTVKLQSRRWHEAGMLQVLVFVSDPIPRRVLDFPGRRWSGSSFPFQRW